MTPELALFTLVILAGFYMAWSIGANDVANAMGTSVGSGALTLKQAVIVAGVLEFSGAFFFGSHVSETVQTGIIDPTLFISEPYILLYGMLASLISAAVWLQFASYYGWPVSTTHTIVGAIIGFGTAVGGFHAIQWANVAFIVSSWLISPILGGLFSFILFQSLRKRIFYASDPVEETKKMTPLLVFIVIGTLSLIMLFKGLKNISLNLSILESLTLCFVLSSLASLIAYLLVKRMKSAPTRPRSAPVYAPEVIYSLDKARKHLFNVHNATKGEIRYHVSILLEEVEGLSDSLKHKETTEIAKSEYIQVEKIFGYLQILSACMMAFAHGANDVANAIGPIAACVNILSTGMITLQSTVPTWTLALGGVGIIIGLATWGWRVIETIGKKITELTPTRGFTAEFGAAATILIASRLGMPISTTHTLVGAVIGVGMARGMEALDLRTTRDIALSWMITIPAGALISVVVFYGIYGIFGV